MQPEKIINNQPVGRKCQGRRDEREKRLSGDPCLHTLRPCQVIRGGRAHKLLIKFWVPPGCDCPQYGFLPQNWLNTKGKGTIM